MLFSTPSNYSLDPPVVPNIPYKVNALTREDWGFFLLWFLCVYVYVCVCVCVCAFILKILLVDHLYHNYFF